jgi:hypothetical protein
LWNKSQGIISLGPFWLLVVPELASASGPVKALLAIAVG